MARLTAGDTALVTGGSGFVGRTLCQVLAARGVRVRVLSRRPGEGPWHELMAMELPAPRAQLVRACEGVDTVFHLAGRAHALSARACEDGQYHTVNVEGTRSVVDAALAAGVRAMVLASSVKAMGEGSEASLDESCVPRPQTPYGYSKLAAEEVVLSAGGGRLHVCALRLPLVYGPGMGGNLSRMLRAVRAGWLPQLEMPANSRSMVAVRDVARAAVLGATLDVANGKVYLVTDGEEYSTARVDAAMRRAFGAAPARLRVPWALLRAAAVGGDLAGRVLRRRLPFDSAALRALSGSARYDGGRLRRELGFVPEHTLEGVLDEMAATAAAEGRHE